MDARHDRPAVLLVDDEAALLRSVRLMLRSAGIDPVLTESDPRQVMARLAGETVGLVLLDVSMPGLGGEYLLGTLRASFPEVPVIMLSATDDPDTVERCLAGGAVGYLVKPVASGRLIAAVRRHLPGSSTLKRARENPVWAD